MKIKEIVTNPNFRVLLGSLILIVIVGGALTDYFEFVRSLSESKIGLLIIFIVVVLSILYLYSINFEKFTKNKGGVPKIMNDTDFQESRLRVDKLSLKEGEIEAMHKLAVDAFKEDAMPLELIRELHGNSNDTVYLLKDSSKGIIGYLALFIPSKELKEQIFAGTIDPLEWEKSQFITGKDCWKELNIYIESTVVSSPNREKRFFILLRHVLRELEIKLKENIENGSTIHFFGLAGTKKGQNLMTSLLNFESVMFAWERKDEMELMAGHKTIKDITNLKNRIETCVDCLLSKSYDFKMTQ